MLARFLVVGFLPVPLPAWGPASGNTERTALSSSRSVGIATNQETRHGVLKIRNIRCLLNLRVLGRLGLVQAQEIKTVGSRGAALQDSSSKRQERMSWQLQPLKLTDTSTKLSVYILSKLRHGDLDRFFDCVLVSILDHEIEMDFDPRFQS